MAQCHLCGKNLGFFGKIALCSEMRSPELSEQHTSLIFCKSCAPSWPRKHKEEIAAVVCEGTAPIEKFRISNVKTQDPTGRTGQGITTRTVDYCYGDLVFTDKGICFLGISTLSESSSLRFSPTKIIRDVAQQGRAYAKSRDYKRNSGHVLLESIRAAERLLFFPKKPLVSVTFSTWGGLKIDAQDRFWAFDLPQDKETYKQFKKAISSYLGHSHAGEHSETKNPALTDENINILFRKAIDLWLETGSVLHLRDHKVIESFILALKHDDSVDWESVDSEIIEGLLLDITGENFGQNVEQWQKWWDENKGELF